MKKISIIGSGVVGQSVGYGFEKLGYDVYFYNRSSKILKHLKEKGHKIIETAEAIGDTDVAFICVPTPYGTGHLENVIDAVQYVASGFSHRRGNYHLFVIKSTVMPFTTEKIIVPLIAKLSGLKDIGVCMNPEFLTEISGTWTEDQCFTRDFFSEDKIVIGEMDKKSGDLLEELYKPLQKPIFRTDLHTAEFIKYASNCMLATKISFWNEVFLICQKIGIDSQLVADIAGLDLRIGKYGTIHGKAFGGKCLPKDLKSFIEFAEKFRNVKLLKAVDEINEEMKKTYGVRE